MSLCRDGGIVCVLYQSFTCICFCHRHSLEFSVSCICLFLSLVICCWFCAFCLSVFLHVASSLVSRCSRRVVCCLLRLRSPSVWACDGGSGSECV